MFREQSNDISSFECKTSNDVNLFEGKYGWEVLLKK